VDAGIVAMPEDDAVTMAAVTIGLTEVFSEVFEVEARSDDDFFQLGGDSFTAETLLAAVEEKLGARLSISSLLDASSPATMAAGVLAARRSRVPRSLIAVRRMGKGMPLFCTHGANGEATFPRKVAEVVHSRPIYALRALGLLDGEVPFISARDVAAHYVSEIRSVDETGPYLLLGHCGASIIAYEMAQQIKASGGDVAGLILLDPHSGKRAPWLDASMPTRWYRRWQARKAGRAIRHMAATIPGMKGDARRDIVEESLKVAFTTYQPQPYDGPVLAVVSSDRAPVLLDRERGYPSLIRDLETLVIEGNHKAVFTGMNRDAPGKLAQALTAFIDRIDPA
jgi:thioesterase domain-containing protein/acyl carrier protein